MDKPKVFFRADGGNRMGLGHIIRSCALAQMLHDDFECIFVVRTDLIAEVKELVRSYVDSVLEIDASLSPGDEAARVLDHLDAQDILVTDGYHFDTHYQQAARENGNIVVTIDDIHATHYVSDVIINHAGAVTAGDYSKEWYTRTCLGPDFMLLRKPFWPVKESEERKELTEDAVFVNLGGADPNNDVSRILEQCIVVAPHLAYQVVIGAAYHHASQLRQAADGHTTKVIIHQNLEAGEMAALMRKCAFAITSPSTVSYEYLAIGGRLFLHVIADNQQGIYDFFTGHDMASPFADFPHSRAYYRLKTDFVGNLRHLFRGLQLESRTVLRKAVKEDAELIFNWVNDPVVREQSYSKEAIKWEDHCSWYNRKIESPDSDLFILTINDVPAGQIRFDTGNKETTISFLLDGHWRGKGLGSILLKKGIQRLLGAREIDTVIGYVKKTNVASCKAFEKAGFSRDDTQEHENSFKFYLNLDK